MLFNKTLGIIMIYFGWFKYSAFELGPSLRKKKLLCLRSGSTSVLILWANTAQGHHDSPKMVAAQSEMKQAKTGECQYLQYSGK